MSDKYTAEQMEAAADSVDSAWCKNDPLVRAPRCHLAANMLRQAAQMMREREVGGKPFCFMPSHIVNSVRANIRQGNEAVFTASTQQHDPSDVPLYTARRAAVPDGCVLIAIERGEGYEDVHPELVAEDCMQSAVDRGWRYQVIAAAPEVTECSK